MYFKQLAGGKLTLTAGVAGATNLVLNSGTYVAIIYVDENGNVTSQGMTATDTVEAGNNQPVTSDAVNSAISGAVSGFVTGVKGDSEADYRTGNVNITKDNIGLGNVDNTSDVDKPVSTAQETAISTAETNAKNLANATGTLAIGKGGTGATSAKGAEYNIIGAVETVETTFDDDRYVAVRNQTVSASAGSFRWFKVLNLWNYIKDKISSVLGLDSTNYGGKASTAGTADNATNATNGVFGRLGGANQASSTNFTDLISEVSGASSGGGICGGSICTSAADKGVPAGWYNFLYIPHRTGIGGDNYLFGTLLLYPMVTNSDLFYVIHHSVGTVYNAKVFSCASSPAWSTARNFTISDNDSTNSGPATSVNGSSAVTLKLPATIKASLDGNSATATTAYKIRTSAPSSPVVGDIWIS